MNKHKVQISGELFTPTQPTISTSFIRVWIGFSAPVYWSRCKLNMCPILAMCQHRSDSNALEYWSQTVPHL
jgi:hypothetical protein